MIVQLTGTTSGVSVRFMDDKNYNFNYGYRPTFVTSCHSCNAINTSDLKGSNFTGFYNNLPIGFATDKGVGERGEVLRGISFGPRAITWNFTPVVGAISGGISPNEILNILIEAGEIIEVLVNDEWTGYYFFLPDTTSEGGVISMQTVDVGNGVYWSGGNECHSHYLFEDEDQAYIPKTLPQVLLSPNNGDFYPKVIKFLSATPQNPKVKIGGNKNGTWLSFKLETNDRTIYYDNSINQDEFITINSEDLTIINENGQDRLSEIQVLVGNDPFIKYIAGINIWTLTVNDTEEFDEVLDVASDFRLERCAERLSSTIPSEVTCV